jgi:SH3-like domain-containing protein
MTEPTRRACVTVARASEHVQDIRFRTGDSLCVGHRNQQHPAFVWCATENGHHGWVPEEYIEMVGARDAVARRDYDSAHLTATAGETVDVLDEIGDFLRCRTATGVDGWIPAACVDEITGER